MGRTVNCTDIITHDGCPDGFTSAWLLNMVFPGATLHPGSYGVDPPILGAEAEVIIADFSYSRGIMMGLAKTSKSVIVLDHHKTAQADLVDLPDNVTVEFDMERSGARITYDWITREIGVLPDFVETLVNYVQDRDLWTKELPHTDAIGSVILATPFSLQNWTSLAKKLNRNPAGVIESGVAIFGHSEKVIGTIVERAREITIADYIVLAVDSPYAYGSEVAGRLADGDYAFGAYYLDYPWGRKWGLRSRGEFDVSAVAALFGGGGHKNAAGFEIRGAYPSNPHPGGTYE